MRKKSESNKNAENTNGKSVPVSNGPLNHTEPETGAIAICDVRANKQPNKKPSRNKMRKAIKTDRLRGFAYFGFCFHFRSPPIKDGQSICEASPCYALHTHMEVLRRGACRLQRADHRSLKPCSFKTFSKANVVPPFDVTISISACGSLPLFKSISALPFMVWQNSVSAVFGSMPCCAA